MLMRKIVFLFNIQIKFDGTKGWILNMLKGKLDIIDFEISNAWSCRKYQSLIRYFTGFKIIRQGRQARFGPCLDFGFQLSILSYKKQPAKKIWGRILDLA